MRAFVFGVLVGTALLTGTAVPARAADPAPTPEALDAAIERTGRVVLAGLTFQPDAADLTPHSAATLDAVATFLSRRSDLTFYVVGHSKREGPFTYNMLLSGQRAEAVTDALVGTYRIDRSRLDPHGAGPLAPRVAAGAEDAATRNARIELVLR